MVYHGELKEHQHAGWRTHVLSTPNTLNYSVFLLFQGILNPMQAFLNTLAFHGWTGFDVDLRRQPRRELAWDSVSTSVPNAPTHNPMVGSTLLYQSHVQEAKKNMMSNGQHHSDAISVLSEGNWVFSDSKNSPIYQGWWSSKAWCLLMLSMAGPPPRNVKFVFSFGWYFIHWGICSSCLKKSVFCSSRECFYHCD